MAIGTIQSPMARSWLAVYFICLSSSLLLNVPIQIWKRRRSSIKVLPNHRFYIKLFLGLIFLGLQTAILVVHLKISSNISKEVIISDAISILAALGVSIISFIDHGRSVQPSSSVILFLLGFLIGNVLQLTAPALGFETASNLEISQLCLTLIWLIVECQGKESILRDQYKHLSPEETASILSRVFFGWIYPVLWEGNRKILMAEDLPHSDHRLNSKALRRKVLQTWDQRVKPEGKSTLPLVLLYTLMGPFLSAILPRLFLIIFRYSQAVLINVTIKYVTGTETESTDNSSGYWFVLMAVVVYVGMAISTALYQHRLNRLKIMVRGSLVSLIYHRSLSVLSGTYDDGNAVTLMSNDVDGLDSVGNMFHETWAQLIEVTVGLALLAREIGWLTPIPLVIIFFCSRMSRHVAKNLRPRQKNWNVATQKRIAMTTSMLGAAKSIKMLGISDAIENRVTDLRVEEIEVSKKLRWLMAAYNASANALGIFAPVITLVLFAIIAKYNGDGKLTADTAFTTVALLAMITHPANMIMTIVPRAVASLANFERIHNYLVESSREDHRIDLKTKSGSGADQETTKLPAVIFENMTIQYKSASKPVLQDVNLKIDKGSIVMCSGPVGCGKTTLAKAILGEVSPTHGSVAIASKRIGLCTQLSWLPSASIREAICGFDTSPDTEWYNNVTDACGLKPDLAHLPDGDQTLIGSRGSNLSGGQRQRVALARAVYARCDILILDDPFSALDGKTEQHLVDSLLGSKGIFRKMGTTVFIITNTAQHFPLADQIVILGNSGIQMQGSWEEMKNLPEQIAKISLLGESHHTDVKQSSQPKLEAQKRSVIEAASDLTRKTGDLTLYGYYLKAVGPMNVLFMVACTATYAFIQSFAQYWLKWWTEADSSKTWFYISGYLILTILGYTATQGVFLAAQIKIAPRSGAALHKLLLRTIIGAPLSFHSNTDIGITLNRFGQDIQLVDQTLPPALMSLVTQICKLLVQAILLFAMQALLATILPFCMIIVYIVQKVYLRTSRQLRLIDLESRSAIYSSFLETVEGMTTIRAFGWQSWMEDDNLDKLENSQRPLYLLFCLQRWLNIVLNLVIAAVAIGFIALAVILRGQTSGAQVGVALNLILVANTTLISLVESWASLEISLGAISRLRSIVKETPKEDQPGEDLVPSSNWPSNGSVDINHVTAAYNPNAIALKDLDLKIIAGQKLVICGRTGSGKSSLLLTLLHLLDIQAGSIKIDDVDISRVPRNLLRQRGFVAVPQDSFLFAGASLRFNMDPSGTVSDAAIVTALEKTRLWHLFAGDKLVETGDETSADKWTGILDQLMSDLPPLSTGQLQLLSLARAILRVQPSSSPTETRPIILLDEATSSLDPETETAIQDIIHQEFTETGHTVIIISHRISAFTKGMRPGIDAVVWMKDGKVQKIDDVNDLGISREED